MLQQQLQQLQQQQLPAMPSPDLFDLDLGMAFGDDVGNPTSPSAQLVPDSMDLDGHLSMSSVDDDLSQAVLDDLALFDTGYDALGKYVNPTVTVGGAPAQTSHMSVPTHAFLGGGGGARATPSPFSTSSESSSTELPPMIKDEDLELLSRPAIMAAPDSDDKKALAAHVQLMFPKAALRSSPAEWKVFRSRVKGLSKDEQRMVATLRRKELSCVYAEKARQRRIKKMKSSGEDNQQLRDLLDVKDSRIASLEKQLADLQRKSGGSRGRR